MPWAAGESLAFGLAKKKKKQQKVLSAALSREFSLAGRRGRFAQEVLASRQPTVDVGQVCPGVPGRGSALTVPNQP